MKGHLRILLTFLLLIIITFSDIQADNRWNSSFDTSKVTMSDADVSVMTIDMIVDLVALNNPSLRSYAYRREAANNQLKQAGLWKNPEFSTEFEEVGWDAPGLSESEISIALSQEFEIFGQRDARKNVALAGIKSTNFETMVEAFDLYVEVKRRFFNLFYNQNKMALADSSVMLAENIVKSIEFRMNRGAALQSEFLLAQLELQRIKLDYRKVKQELHSSQIELAALWNGNKTNITVSSSNEPNLANALDKLHRLKSQLDSTRYVQQLGYDIEKVRAEKQLVSKEAKPNVTLSGGFKRIEVNNSNSFLFGISVPLPLFNKNQGKAASLQASIQSKEYEQEKTRIETGAYINSSISHLTELKNQHVTLDTLLLPTAENAYNTIKETYAIGRIPYTSFLEAERSLINLRLEHNDILFAIYEQLFAIEQISGIRIYK